MARIFLRNLGVVAHDLVIRNGTIVGDVAISEGVVSAVGAVDGAGAREIDATGLLVTPGFVDLHTHYDGQASVPARVAGLADRGRIAAGFKADLNEVIDEHGVPTAARPGKLVRGRQSAPAA